VHFNHCAEPIFYVMRRCNDWNVGLGIRDGRGNGIPNSHGNTMGIGIRVQFRNGNGKEYGKAVDWNGNDPSIHGKNSHSLASCTIGVNTLFEKSLFFSVYSIVAEVPNCIFLRTPLATGMLRSMARQARSQIFATG